MNKFDVERKQLFVLFSWAISFFFITQFVCINNAYAKNTQEVAIDMIAMSEVAEKYFETFQMWPNSFFDLEDEGLLDDLDIEDQVSSREYRIYQSDNRFGIGVSETLIETGDLDLYLPNLTNFAGYNWIFIEKEIEIEEPIDQDFDYYEKLLPFVSNTKLIIDGKIFNPQN